MKSLVETIYHIRKESELLGRVHFEDGALCLPWSGAGVSIRFVGSSVAFSLLDYVTDWEDFKTVIMRLEVDGVVNKCAVSSGKEVIFCDGLEDCEHTATLTKVSESITPIRLNEVEIIGESPKILPVQEKKYSFKMEVVGDSITCGYGSLGVGERFVPHEEDSSIAYASLAARELGAQLRLISASGRGLCRNYDGSGVGLFSDFFPLKTREADSPAHDFDSWQPDVVVINGGTNDFNSGAVSEDDFSLAAENFYKLVRGVYPESKILFFYGAMGQQFRLVYEKLVEKLQKIDTGVYFAATDHISSELGEVAVMGHPSAAGQRRVANDLIAALKAIM